MPVLPEVGSTRVVTPTSQTQNFSGGESHQSAIPTSGLVLMADASAQEMMYNLHLIFL